MSEKKSTEHEKNKLVISELKLAMDTAREEGFIELFISKQISKNLKESGFPLDMIARNNRLSTNVIMRL